MYELAVKFIESLSSYPGLQALGAVVLLLVVGPYIMRRAETDRKSSGVSNVPSFVLMSPVSDVFGAIHDMAEQHRNANTMLTEVCKTLKDIDTGQKYTHDLLEDIIRNQVSADTMAHPHRKRPL